MQKKTYVCQDGMTKSQPMVGVSYQTPAGYTKEGHVVKGYKLSVYRYYKSLKKFKYLDGDGLIFPTSEEARKYAIEHGYVREYFISHDIRNRHLENADLRKKHAMFAKTMYHTSA